MSKKILAVAGCLAIMVAAFSVQAESTPASDAAPALVISDFGCNLIDGNGAFAFTTDTHGVVTNSNNDNAMMRCQAQVTPSPDGRAVRWSQDTHPGLQCNVLGRLTDDWRNVVSASGNATLICQFKD
jgi:hypothetical protein